MLDELLKDMIKKYQKAQVRNGIASTMTSKATISRYKVKETADSQLATMKSDLNKTASTLGDAVKGQFGNQVQRNFETASNNLKSY